MKKIKSYLNKIKVAKIKKQKELEIKAIGQIINSFHNSYDDEFNISDYISNRLDKLMQPLLEQYTNTYYNDGKGFKNLFREVFTKKIKEKFTEYFDEEFENKMKEEIEKISLWDIKSSDSFNKFTHEFIHKNSILIELKMQKVFDDDKFLEYFQGDVEEFIKEKALERLKQCEWK